MSRESLNKLQELTGFARATIKTRLSTCQPIEGPRGAQLYETREALPFLYDNKASVYETDKERARLLHHQANLADLDEQVKQGRLIPAEQVEAEWGGALMNIRARMLAIPSQIAARCVNSTQEQIQAEASELVRQALEELASHGGD